MAELSYVESVLLDLIKSRLSQNAETEVKTFLVEIQGNRIIGVSDDLISRVQEDIEKDPSISEIRKVWQRERGGVYAAEEFDRAIATSIAHILSNKELLKEFGILSN
ncbi:hypothetical protein [Bifidobacterium xylocopae]|nr:hypothetical protein [Bifidobacterium xylocopae]